MTAARCTTAPSSTICAGSAICNAPRRVTSQIPASRKASHPQRPNLSEHGGAAIKTADEVLVDSWRLRPLNTIPRHGMQAASPTSARHLRASLKVAIIQLKFGVHWGNPVHTVFGGIAMTNPSNKGKWRSRYDGRGFPCCVGFPPDAGNPPDRFDERDGRPKHVLSSTTPSGRRKSSTKRSR